MEQNLPEEESNVLELASDAQFDKIEPIENNTHVDREFYRIKEMQKEIIPLQECLEYYKMQIKKMQDRIDYRLNNLENYGLQQCRTIASVYGKVAVRSTKLKINYDNADMDRLIEWAKESGYENLVKVSLPKESFSKSEYKKLFSAKGEMAPGIDIETDVVTAKATVE